MILRECKITPAAPDLWLWHETDYDIGYGYGQHHEKRFLTFYEGSVYHLTMTFHRVRTEYQVGIGIARIDGQIKTRHPTLGTTIQLKSPVVGSIPDLETARLVFRDAGKAIEGCTPGFGLFTLPFVKGATSARDAMAFYFPELFF